MHRLVSDVRSRAIDSLNSLNMPLNVAMQTVEEILAHDPHMDATAIVMEALGRVSSRAKQSGRNNTRMPKASSQDGVADLSGYQKFLEDGLIRPPDFQQSISNDTD
jgi:hypothetical protein